MTRARLRLAFMGTPSYALPTLEALTAHDHEICQIWTKPPSPQGRGLKARPSAVAEWARQRALPLCEQRDLRGAQELEKLRALNLDAVIIVSFGIILPKALLSIPRLGCLNLHPSLLPRWRGAAPIARALWAGDSKTGVSIIQIGESVDSGAILAQEEIIIGDMNAGQLSALTSRLGAKLMVESLERFARSEITPTPQDDSLAVMADRLTAAEEKIDWQLSASKLLCQIRALSPTPGAWFKARRGERDVRVRLSDAQMCDGAGRAGEVLDEKNAIIACGEGALRLRQLQREGRRSMPAADFLIGFPLSKGERLS